MCPVRRLLALVLFLAPLAATAQDPPIRWGRLSDEEKAIDAWPGDSDASAIVLGDVGYAEMILDGSGPLYRLRRHRRVKVLDEDAYEMGEVAMRYHDDDHVRRVRGQTFVPDGNGDYRRVELSGRDVHDDRVGDDLREVRFSMPALAPGAIFEYEYTYETEDFVVLPPWYFQSEEPTVVSEYRLDKAPFFDYVTFRQGDHIEEQEPRQLNRPQYRMDQFRWIARDVPALRDEPYTTTEADYVERIGFQLNRINRLDGFRDDILKTWEQVAQEFRDHPMFGRRVEGNRRVRQLAQSVSGTVGEKARALYDIVRRGYVWNGKGGIFAERDLGQVLETRSGSEGELTFLLLALYEEAGVPATPVVLSGRSNGRAIMEYPIVEQFDTILALVQVPGEPPELVSPLSPNRPYGQIPVDALNTNAWMVDYDQPRWISYDAPGGAATTTFVQGTLSEDGALEGTLQLRLNGYHAFDARERLDKAESDSPAAAGDAVEETADAEDDVEIEVVEVSGTDDPAEPLGIEATFVAPPAEVVGDEMYLTPFIAMQMEENPFERETRTFPVDFAYPFTRTYVAAITLPEGWEAVDLPEPVQMTIPSRAVTYQRLMSSENGQLQVRAVLSVGLARVEPAEYPSLRDLYDEIVAAETEAVVIARLAEAEVAAEAPADDAEAPVADSGPDDGGPDDGDSDEGDG